MRAFFIAVAAFMPVFANAAVVINEIAWMGTAVSSSDEWIELHNDGSEDVSLAGWRLVADDGAPQIALSGSIPAGGFYLLERTDDQSAPGVPADKIYTGDIANAGETLRLIDKELAVIDIVDGGSNWGSIGGDNATKDTPQRQPDDTWLTGVPTPRVANATTSSVVPGEVAGTSTAAKKIPRRIVTGGYKQVVFAHAGDDITTVVGADAFFEGYAVSDKNERLAAPYYRWSFGDGAKGSGKEVRHAYAHPGSYIVTLAVSAQNQDHRDRIAVTVIPADVRVAASKLGAGGYVEIENGSDTDVDLSEWAIIARHARGRRELDSFVVPRDTVIAASSSVRFPNATTGLDIGADDAVALQFPSGADVP